MVTRYRFNLGTVSVAPVGLQANAKLAKGWSAVHLSGLQLDFLQRGVKPDLRISVSVSILVTVTMHDLLLRSVVDDFEMSGP